MMRKSILTLFLLLPLFVMAADGVAFQRGCRRGFPRESTTRWGVLKAHDNRFHPSRMSGSRRQLVVLASFSDRPFSQEDPTALWNRIFNEESFSEPPYIGSVHDYFHDQSYGKLDLSFDLYYVNVGIASKYESTQVHDENSQFLVDDVLDSLLTYNIDWNLYDWDDDGTVEQLLIVYAGKGMNESGEEHCIWPHQWWLSEHLVKKGDNYTDEHREARSFTYREKEYTVDCYCALAELTSDGVTFGTICHEYSHCFGLPDFYNGNKSYVGSWELMDSGNFNGKGACPASYSAHERMLMGWLTPVELTSDTVISDMKALSDVPEAYIIRNSGHSDEYYIVENRQNNLWDAKLPNSGIIVFHINFNESLWTSTKEYVNKSNRVNYGIIPANNTSSKYYEKGWAYPYNDNNELTSQSQPAATVMEENIDGSYLMGKYLTQMGVDNGLATFKFTNTQSATAINGVHKATYSNRMVDLMGRSSNAPHAGTLYLERQSDGSVRKMVYKRN